MNAHDQDLVNRDTGITGLNLLLQPEALAAELSGLVGPAWHGPLMIDYLRYKPGVNCIARLVWGDRVGYAKAFTGDARAKLEKQKPAAGTRAAGGAGRVVLEAQGVVVSFFPSDAELRSLARLAEPESRRALLQRLFKSDARWGTAKPTLLNYKPERRCVFRLDHPDGRAATLKFFSRREFDATRRSRKKLNLPPGLTLPDWIGGSKIHRAMAYGWLPGQPFSECLEVGRGGEAARAGACIARLHASRQDALGKRATRSPPEILAALQNQLTWLAPELAAEVDGIGTRLARWWAARPPVRQPVHGDFYDRQVIVMAQGIGIIDTDSAHLGDPLQDLGCFLAHLERRRVAGVVSTDDAACVAREFEAGYRSMAPDADLAEVGMHTAYNLFKLTPHPFRDRRPDWPDQTRRLLRACTRLMQAGGG